MLSILCSLNRSLEFQMCKSALSAVHIAFLFVVFVAAQNSAKVLTNYDITEMIKAGLPESTIVLSIQQSKPNFDTSPEALIQMKKLGASSGILDAMVKANAPAVQTYSEDAFGNLLGSGVAPVEGGEFRQLKRMTPTSKTNSAARVIPYIGIFMKGKTYSVFNGNRSDVRTQNPSPEIEIAISSELKIADAVFLIRLDTTKSTRRAEVMREGDLGGSTGVRKKDVIQIRINEVTERKTVAGITHYRTSPVSPLT